MKEFIKKIFTKKSKEWLKAAAKRAIRTFGQTFASLMTVGAAINEIDWGYVASVSVVAAVYSIMTSLSGLPEENNKGGEL